MAWNFLWTEPGERNVPTLALAGMIALVYWLAFVGFAWRHHHVKFDQVAFGFITILNALATALIMTGVTVSAVRDFGYIHFAAMFNLCMPILLNLFIPSKAAVLTLINPFKLVLHMLFLPTMQAYFLTLSIARTHDLSWGNRAGIGQEENHLRSKSRCIMITQIICNTGLVVLYLGLFMIDETIHFYFLAGLAVLFLAPMTVISVGSMVELMGRIGLSILIPFSILVALCNRFSDDIGVSSLRKVPIFLQVPIVICLTLVTKVLLERCCKGRVHARWL